MTRLIIEVSGEQHQKIKVLAALQGKTIKDYVLDKVFPDHETGENQSWDELAAILSARIDEADTNPPASKTFEEITREVLQSRKTVGNGKP